MPPFIHKIQIPLQLVEQFSKGKADKFNSYCWAYLKGNSPEMEPVKVNGKAQDPFGQKGLIYCTYKIGLSPSEKAASRNEAAKTKKPKGKK